MPYQFLYEWQTLIGSFLGATTPISIWFLTEWYKKHNNRKKHLYNLEKLLVYNINNLIDARNTINHFISVRLLELVDNIKSRIGEDVYSCDIAFFPLFSIHPPDENILEINTESGYLDNKLIQTIKMSKDFAIAIDDLRQQFMNTIQVNRDMAFSKLNPPKFQNEAYLRNIEEFRNVVKRDIFEKNIKVYMRTIVSTRVALNVFRDLGIIRWRFKFEPHFKYFKNRQDLKKFRDNIYELIDKFLEEKINFEVNKMEDFYS